MNGILSPILTPFDKNGQVDYDTFVRNIERWNNTSLSGYLVLGSNGETPYLNEEEKLKLIELTVQSAAKDRVILAGTGLESTQETIRFTNKAAKLGARAALVLTPSYYGGQMTDQALIKHFTAVADHADLPILIYNVPKYTHLNISVEAVRTLSGHPKIIGMKDSRGDIGQLETFKKTVPDDFNLVVGSASILYSALNLGIRAAILAPANFLPLECTDMIRLYDAGEHANARQLQDKLLPVNKAVTDTYGIPGLKFAAALKGFEGGHVRSPLLPLSPQEQTAVRTILVNSGFLS